MRNLRVVLLSAFLAVSSLSAYAQTPVPFGCVKVDQIARWEVLDETKTIVYDSQGNSIAFIVFTFITTNLSKSKETFRFFSSTICPKDRVQTSNGMTTVATVEPIRK